MTPTPEPQPSAAAAAEPGTTAEPEPGTTDEPTPNARSAPGVKASASRKVQGDVHVGTMAGDVKRVPGSGTENGDKAIADVMREVLERVRRSIRERANPRRR